MKSEFNIGDEVCLNGDQDDTGIVVRITPCWYIVRWADGKEFYYKDRITFSQRYIYYQDFKDKIKDRLK